MILDKEVVILCTSSNLKYYKNLGYDVKNGEYITVKVEDIQRWSKCIIRVKCDYCGAISEIPYYSCITHRKIISKDCCRNTKCMKQKREESVLKTYGVTAVSQLESVQEVKKKNNMIKYGCVCPLQNEEIKQKSLKTMMEIYGCAHPMESDVIKQKIKNTCLERYGVENVAQNCDIRDKQMQTMIERYGDYNVPTSSQQIYIQNLYNGILNFKYRGFFGDILLEEYNIIIEYSGGGHRMPVMRGFETDEEFDAKQETRRKVFLDGGYKQFEIISKTDVLPDDNFLLILKDKAITVLIEYNYEYYSYNLDTNEETYK